MIDPFKMDALANWLTAGAPPRMPIDGTVLELARRMVGAGLSVATLSIFVKTINPRFLGTRVSWTPRKGVELVPYSHAQLASSEYVGSIPEATMESGRTIRMRLGTSSPYDAHPASQLMLSRGITDYVVCPLFGRFTPASAMAVGTKAAGGFSDDDVATIRRLQAPLARVVESVALHENTVSVLSTYVGRNAGEKVMDGRILRGHTEDINAVILFADLRNFTALSNTLPPEQTVALLNTFFEAMDDAIRANGGETLKFIGDGLLAIFPTEDEPTAQTAAAMGAISALDDARAILAARVEGPEFTFRAALHMGDIHYGNIGSPTRLDFTAVGPAVNLTARLLQASAELDVPTVCSDAFAPLARARCTPTRAFTFKGFSDPIMVHKVG